MSANDKEKPAPKNNKYQMGADPLKRNTTWGRSTVARKTKTSNPRGKRIG